MKTELSGYLSGFLGVLGFSLTLPATRVAVSDLDPVFVGLGRAVMAAILAAIALLLTRQSLPPRRFLPRFALIVAGVIVGFPVLSAWAMEQVPASHGAVVTGLLPLATALAAVWRGKERPSLKFWLFSLLGSVLAIAFALNSGSGALHLADLALLGAVIAAGIGYAEGAVLSRTFGAWQVIAWALVFSIPFLLPIILASGLPKVSAVSYSAWIGFIYVSFVSMFLAFIAWYRGLAIGGIARIGQMQLLQPFLTIIASGLLLKEQITRDIFIYAMGVSLCVALGRSKTKQDLTPSDRI
jgi:drug/metabolite transporter (DMT)-like permease